MIIHKNINIKIVNNRDQGGHLITIKNMLYTICTHVIAQRNITIFFM